MREVSITKKQLVAATENIAKNERIKALEEKVEALATNASVSENNKMNHHEISRRDKKAIGKEFFLESNEMSFLEGFNTKTS